MILCCNCYFVISIKFSQKPNIDNCCIFRCLASPPGDIGSPLQLLQGDFESSDQEIRLRAIKRAVLVAEAVGPDVTRDELIPYLASIVDDDDEILLAIAAQLAHFVPLIGGSAHAGLLLPM